jgi:acetyltransferase-like isoleucine patch superfamily enzyme
VFYEGRDSVKAKFSRHTREKSLRTTIGHDVWIGHSVLIKQGITIGTGAVIGMGSVVTKDVEPYSVYAGVPAKPIRMRFDEDTVQKLLKTEWWTFKDADLEKYAQYFTNPGLFLENFEK